ncbi:formyltransferase family protein [Paraflavitalea sp. CAU 1676]|uniref:methionyl-tRNA formyltransferase n=1 Tax=Paraflavitalea sp. CAU 1676 TaxID=3032598 RepID=UPI0023D9ADC1|nr:formyltransferase family protein [Paraflavitalea sp. CAU 1676]MDF2191833.1 formyltransferase family protein [Paraflavitalea sp. CAU 1676]
MTRIAILCNDRLALPALAALLQAGRVAAVGMADGQQDIRPLVERMSKEAAVSCTFFSRTGFQQQLFTWLHQHHPDVVLVKTFPWKIPAAALGLPRFGFINFHYAPLPAWRGANPLFWMIRNRVAMGGITVHQMDAAFDNGPVILQVPVPIQPQVTYGILNTQLAYAGLQVAQHLLQLLDAGSIHATPQDESQACWHRKPEPADLVIDWNTMKAVEVMALVKACNPWNKGAATSWNGWTFGITEASVHTGSPGPAPGTVTALDAAHGLLIACADGQLIRAEVVYCEEGFFTGAQLALFGLKKHERLGSIPAAPVQAAAVQETSGV